MNNFGSISTFAVVISALIPLSAQWLHYPTPGIPRTPDGKPNLSAPAPKTADGKPDLSGIWTSEDHTSELQLSQYLVDRLLLAKTDALYKQRPAQLQKGHAS